MKQNVKVPVSERALFGRVSRALAHDGKILKKSRPDTGCFNKLGFYYIVKLDCNIVLDHHVDLKSLAKDLNRLAPWEEYNP